MGIFNTQIKYVAKYKQQEIYCVSMDTVFLQNILQQQNL